MILSEFANAYLRLDFNIWKNKPENAGKTDYKRDYVGTVDFNDTVEDVKTSIKKILSITEKFNDCFNSIDIESVFIHFGQSDFNDSYYVELAKLSGYKIVSDDSDLIKINASSIPIITANL